MSRGPRIAPATFAPALAFALALTPGCGGDDGPDVRRSEVAVKADTKGQDAMREFMQARAKRPGKSARSR